jgi:glycerol-3-phosphate responsive antiterminator
MKRKLIIILCFVGIVFGCQSRQLEIPEVIEPSVEPNLNLINENYVYVNAIVNNQEQILAVEMINPVEIINHSFLTKENIGEAITVYGILQQQGNNWILIENSKSKSRVTFFIEDSESFEKMFAKNAEKKVKVVGVLKDVKNAWQKTMLITSLEPVVNN